MDLITSEPHTIITDIKKMIENNTQKEIVTLFSFSSFMRPLFYTAAMDYCKDDKTIQSKLTHLNIIEDRVEESPSPLISILRPLANKPKKILRMVSDRVLFWETDNLYEVSKKANDIHTEIVMKIREKATINYYNNIETVLFHLSWHTLFYILYYSSYTPLDAVWNQLKLLLPTTLKNIDFRDEHDHQLTQDDIHDILTLNDDARLDLLMNHLNINLI